MFTPSALRAKLNPKLSCPKLTGPCLDHPTFLYGECTYTNNRINFLAGSFGSKGQIVSEGNKDQFHCTSWQLPDKWMPGSCHSAVFTSQISYLNPLTHVQVLRCDIVRGHSVVTSTFTLTCSDDWQSILVGDHRYRHDRTSDKDVSRVGLISRLGGDT